MFPPVRLRHAFRLGGLSPREAVIRTWSKMNENEIMTRASAVSFYAMLACVPFLALVLTVLVQLLPDVTGKRGDISGQSVAKLDRTLKETFPKEAYEVARDQIGRLQDQLHNRTPVALYVAGLLTTLWLASSLYTAIIDALNRIYGVSERRSLVKVRLVAILMTIIQAAILLGALIAIVAGPEIMQVLHIRGHATLIGRSIQWAAVLVMVLLSFALSYYVGPDADQEWEWITPGSLLGSVVFIGFTYLFRIYVQNFANYNKTYGSLGGVMVLLFWFWVTATVLLTAGQLNKVIEEASPLGRNHGQRVDPTHAPDFKAMAAEPSQPD